jgi:hypothetical protein
MALDLTQLTAELQRDNEVNSSASTLITNLAAQFEAVKGDPAAIQALVDQLRSQNDSLAAAVAANTPGA